MNNTRGRTISCRKMPHTHTHTHTHTHLLILYMLLHAISQRQFNHDPGLRLIHIKDKILFNPLTANCKPTHTHTHTHTHTQEGECNRFMVPWPSAEDSDNLITAADKRILNLCSSLQLCSEVDKILGTPAVWSLSVSEFKDK